MSDWEDFNDGWASARRDAAAKAAKKKADGEKEMSPRPDWMDGFLQWVIPAVGFTLVVMLLTIVIIVVPTCVEQPPEKWTPTTFDRDVLEPSLCGQIAAMSPDEFAVWMKPRAVSEVPWAMACILKEARR